MITLKDLSKIVISEGQEKYALQDINLQFGDRGLVAISGNKGSGKSCLLRMIAQEDDISAGAVFADGIDLSKLTEREIENYRTHYVGIVNDIDELFSELTVEENILMGASFGRIKPAKETLDMLYEALELKNILKKKPRDLTEEERVITQIARIMVKNPKVLLIDNFDHIFEQDTMLSVWRFLKSISEKHLVVIVSNSRAYVEKFADRHIVLVEGKVASISGSDIINDQHTAETNMLNKALYLKKHKYDLASTFRIIKQFFKTSLKTIIRTSIIALILLIGVVFSSTLVAFDGVTALASSTLQRGDKYIEFFKGTLDDKESLNYDTTVGTSIVETLNKSGFKYVFMVKHEVNWETNINNTNFKVTSFITNSEVLQVGDVNKFNQKLLAGSYTGSAAASNYAENGRNIVISDYMAELIIKNGMPGFASGQNSDKVFRESFLYNSLINCVLRLNGNPYRIVGIYETDFDKYVDSNLDVISGNEQTFEYNLKNVYSVIHVNTRFYSHNPKEIEYMKLSNSEINAYNIQEQTHNKSIFATNETIKIYGDEKTEAGVMLANSNIGNTINLGNNMIVVSVDILYELEKLERNQTEALTEQEKLAILEVFMPKEEDKVPGGIDAVLGPNYKKIMIDNFETEFSIIGVILDESVSKTIIMNSDKVIDSEQNTRSVFERLFISKYVDTNGIVVPIGSLRDSEIAKMINQMYELGYSVYTLASDTVNSISTTMNIIRIAFIAVAIVLIIVTVLILSRFAKKVYKENKHSVSILKALGATDLNMNVSVSAIIAIILVVTMIVATLIGLLLSFVGNLIVQTIMAFKVNIFMFNIWLVLIACLVLVLIGIFLPKLAIKKYQNMTVMDLRRDI